ESGIVLRRTRHRGGHRRTRSNRAVADVAHHARIAIEPIEGLGIAGAKFAQRQPLGLQEWLCLCHRYARLSAIIGAVAWDEQTRIPGYTLTVFQPASPNAASCSVWNSWASAVLNSNRSPSMI